MSGLVLFFGIGLIAMWIIALATGGVAAWFLWLTFAVAVILACIGIAEMMRVAKEHKRHEDHYERV